MLLLQYYVPVPYLEQVNLSLFNAGLGRYGNYDCCAWVTLGRGQFRPLEGSNPATGKQGVIELVDEYKVELVCPLELKDVAVQILLAAHPYETPAYGFINFIS